MKLRYATSFSTISLLVSTLYALLIMRDGVQVVGVILRRQYWIIDHTALWVLGMWLWLIAIFGWMVVLVTLMWSYLPGHRVSSMLQSGLMIIAAVLAIAGVVIWMSVMPWAATQENVVELFPLIDAFVLGLAGAAFFMGGAVTAWIAFDLSTLDHLPRAWTLPLMLAGISALPSPFLLPQTWYLLLAALLWIGWCTFMATRRNVPSAYTEWG